MPRFDIPFRVDGETQTITATGAKKIRAGSKNYWYAVFTFADNTFDGMEYLSATFSTEPYSRNRGRAKIIPIEDGQCLIPWEVLTRKGTVYVGLFAGDMLVTNEAEIEVTAAAPTLGGESAPTESWYSRFEAALDDKQDKLTAGENITIEGNVISAPGGGSSGSDGHSPYIGSNGNWYAYDDDSNEYIDTGVHAQGATGATGPAGATGPQGPQGPQGPKGDDGTYPVIYGQTTFAAIKAAYDAQKLPVLYESDAAYPCIYCDTHIAIFAVLSDDAEGFELYKVTSGDVWSDDWRDLSSVTSVNGQTGEVELDAEDVGAVAKPNEVTVSDAGAISQECADNTIYTFTGALTSLTLTEATGAREYIVIFTTGSTAPTVTFPSGVVFPDTLTIEANKRYEVSVRDGYAVAQSWAVSA